MRLAQPLVAQSPLSPALIGSPSFGPNKKTLGSLFFGALQLSDHVYSHSSKRSGVNATWLRALGLDRGAAAAVDRHLAVCCDALPLWRLDLICYGIWKLRPVAEQPGHKQAFYRKLRRLGADLLITGLALKGIASVQQTAFCLGSSTCAGHRHDQELWKENMWHKNHMGMTCIVTGGGGGITSEVGTQASRAT